MTYSAGDLQLEMREPGDLSLVRLFRRTGGEWDEPPAAFRTMRYDPPAGYKNDYSLLYTGEHVEAIAMECDILAVDRAGAWTYDEAKAKASWVARYQFTNPAIFIPMDVNRHRFNIDRRPFVPGYGPFQEAAHELWRRFGATVHGLSWWSMHRHQPGRVYALWHHHKATLGLVKPTGPFNKLHEDADWKAFLAANPACTKLTTSSGAVGTAGAPLSKP